MDKPAIETLQSDLADQMSRLVRVQAAFERLSKMEKRSEDEEKALIAADGTVSALTNNIAALQQQIAFLRGLLTVAANSRNTDLANAPHAQLDLVRYRWINRIASFWVYNQSYGAGQLTSAHWPRLLAAPRRNAICC